MTIIEKPFPSIVKKKPLINHYLENQEKNEPALADYATMF